MSPLTRQFMILTALLAALSCAVAVSTGAQPLKGQSPIPVFDAAHQITVQGTVQEVVTHPAPGSLLGLHLMMASAGATQDVHLGPYMSKDVTEKILRANSPVQVVGVMAQLHGKPVLLARQLIIGGRTIVVRNEHGFLVRSKPEGMEHHRTSATRPALKGDLQ